MDTICALDATDPAGFRAALGRFASGVVVISGLDEQLPVGMTCQSFSSLSLDPPLVLFSAARTSTSFPRLRQARRLCVNVLAHDQDQLSAQFARSGTDKWRDVRWTPGGNGAPRITGAAMWCEGDIVAVHDGGDHFIVVVRVTSLATSAPPRPPLIYHDGEYARLQRRKES
jgi:3-hydroxy-9,10-secoandrosta-1,3,5(10)-triene-9,17-dione monooxygenase reductase component